MTLQASALRSSLIFKVLFIAFLVLVLLIPMNMVENIIRERGHLYRHANDEIVSIWGESHSFAGPLLTLPLLRVDGVAVSLIPLADEKVKDAVIFQASVPVNKSGVNEFEIEYEVAGSSEFNLSAMAKNTKLTMKSESEHINFNFAYLLSASSSCLLISLYSKSVLQNKAKAILVMLVLIALYTYLYITLQSEGFALVTGSIGLFCIMAMLMYLTRNTNWHALSLAEKQ